MEQKKKTEQIPVKTDDSERRNFLKEISLKLRHRKSQINEYLSLLDIATEKTA